MVSVRKYFIKIHTLPSNMGIFTKCAVLGIMYQRNITLSEGYACGEFEGMPMMVPCEKKVKTFIDAVMSVLQDAINENNIKRCVMHIFSKNKKLTEHWLFEFVPKCGKEESVWSDLNNIMLKVAEIASQLPLLQEGCNFTLDLQHYNDKSKKTSLMLDD